jgi:hypothetical protein
MGWPLGVIAALVWGCTGCLGDAFVCTSSAQCVLAGQAGTCEPTGYCSFAAPECASGRRYGELAADELRGLCVGESPADLAVPGDLVQPDTDLRADLATDMSMVSTCPVGAVICDDFESGTTSKWPGSEIDAPSMYTVDKLQSHSPMYALHGTAPVNGSNESHALVFKPYAKTPPMTFSARMWLYAQTAPGNFGLFLSLRKSAGANLNLGTNGSNMMTVTVNDANLPDIVSGTALPLMQWVCIQMRLDYPTTTASQGRARVFLGKQQVLDFVPAPLLADGDFRVGVVRAPGDDPLSLFVDDVVAAYEDTPCP